MEGMCPTQLESQSAPCKFASCSWQVGDAQEASKDLAGAAGGLRERRASSEAVDVRAQHEPLRADVECESGP